MNQTIAVRQRRKKNFWNLKTRETRTTVLLKSTQCTEVLALVCFENKSSLNAPVSDLSLPFSAARRALSGRCSFVSLRQNDDDDREKGTFDVSSHLEQKSHLSPLPGTGVDPELTLL